VADHSALDQLLPQGWSATTAPRCWHRQRPQKLPRSYARALVVRIQHLVPAPFFRHAHESGHPELAPGLNRGRPLSARSPGPPLSRGRRDGKTGTIRLIRSTNGHVANAATSETLRGSYRASDGNDAPNGFGRRSPRRARSPTARDRCGTTCPGLVRRASVRDNGAA
jgi:hypothetical protein